MSEENRCSINVLVKTLVVCEIPLGAECSVRKLEFAVHYRRASQNDFDEEEAVVVGSSPLDSEGLSFVTIKIKKGPRAGMIIEHVDPKYLNFVGIYKKVSVRT